MCWGRAWNRAGTAEQLTEGPESPDRGCGGQGMMPTEGARTLVKMNESQPVTTGPALSSPRP